MAGVFASRVIAQASKVIPAENHFQKEMRWGEVVERKLGMQGLWSEPEEKPIARHGWEIHYPGSGTVTRQPATLG